MSLRRDARHGLRIGRAEFVRSLRGYSGSTRRLAGLAVSLLFFGGQLLFSLPAAYVVGRTARSADAIPYLAPGATLLFAGIFVLSTFRTLERIGGVDAEEFVLMAVHPRAVVLGLVGAELARLAVWFGVPILALVVTFALGLGSPSFVVTAGLVAVPLLCWAAVWGYACGIAVLRALRRLSLLRRVVKAAGVLLLVALVAGSQFAGRYVAEESVSLQELLSVFAFPPLTDYVSLAFVGTPLARPISPSAAVLLAGVVALVPVGLAVATRQASALWFTDAPRRDEPRRPRTSAGGLDAPRPFARTKAGRIAWGVLVRAARNPRELNHLLIAVFFVGPLGTTVVQASGDGLGLLVAGVGVGVGAYLAGATFGLNPLGDDRPQFPLLLLTGTPPRTLLRGRTLAGLAVGVPVAAVVPVASVALGTPPVYGLAFAAAGVGMCLAAAAFAVGLGAAYPLYEEREFWGVETVVPSMLVMMPYTFVVGGGSVVGLVVVWFALAGQLSATPLSVAGVGTYAALLCGVPYVSYRYALRRYRRYTFD
ncbi:hypothetical protein SAMN04488063_3255 [Halopelagius inordinatus]|uniref:ABC-2 type transport system permease protein n=1 Tax=Halopelagius inordinatus TaxID=553467 RepID=A0A1I2VU19_9EURY|nr:hypothetical protein [Halopelagius inordinatus]SFG91046.1 hypothetical protein SAMN04488063_3255 [Halopelagius inordinatus]